MPSDELMAGRAVTDEDRARAIGRALRMHRGLRITRGQANTIRCNVGLHRWADVPSLFSLYDYRRCDRCGKTQRRASAWSKWRDPLITLMLLSPLVGIDSNRVLHAVEMGPVAGSVWKKRKTIDAACGKRVRFWAIAEAPVQWPTQARLPGDYERCRECWLATGKKRPAVTIKRVPEWT